MMYSRAKDRPKAPIRLPDHYSGWAFRDLPPTDEAQQAPLPHTAPPDVIVPTSSIQTEEHSSCDACPSFSALPPPPQPIPPCPPPPKPPSPSFFQPFENLLGKVGSSFPFSHGLGFDELIILGLIILLAHNDHDPDILLLLGLLLFCG